MVLEPSVRGVSDASGLSPLPQPDRDRHGDGGRDPLPLVRLDLPARDGIDGELAEPARASARPVRADRDGGRRRLRHRLQGPRPELDRIVAIKVPRAGNLAAEEDLDRFLREARASPSCGTRRSSPSTRSAQRGRALPRQRLRRGRHPGGPPDRPPARAPRGGRADRRPWPTPCSTPTSTASSTATSSRRTSCSTTRASPT